MSGGKVAMGVDCTLQELGMAYRKAKVDLYKSSRVCRNALLEFESDLVGNLKRIQEGLRRGVLPEVHGDTWTLIPKKLHKDEPLNGSLVNSDPAAKWEQTMESGTPKAEFRVMEKLSVSFHVVASLWIQRVGHKFDFKFHECVLGNRLRRTRSGSLNPLAVGSTVHYFRPYQQWRDDGIRAMHAALDKGKAVIAITADVKSFFHELDPGFMVTPDFMELIEVELEAEELVLHKIFIKAIQEWAVETPLQKGLPVGLVASAVIANAALFELDQLILSEVVPLYYGRYVDDVILVMGNGSGFTRSEDVWKWVCKRMPHALELGEEGNVRFTPAYLSNCSVEFANDKNKVFALEGASGKALVDSIEKQIRQRTSEWQSLPNLPTDSVRIESGLLDAIQAGGEPVDCLRKADGVSVRRANLALQLRGLEDYNRLLSPGAWTSIRHGFLGAFIRHVLVLPRFFDYYAYIPRVIEVAIACGDFDYLREIIRSIDSVLGGIKKCEITVGEKGTGHAVRPPLAPIDVFRAQMADMVLDCVQASIPLSLSSTSRQSWSQGSGVDSLLFSNHILGVAQDHHRSLFEHDLAAGALKARYIPAELNRPNKCVPAAPEQAIRIFSPRLVLHDAAVIAANQVFRKEVGRCESDLPVGLLFPTRPLTLQDLYFSHRSPFSKSGVVEIESSILGFRGYKPVFKLPLAEHEDDRDNGYEVIRIPHRVGEFRKKIRIAVASWSTDDRSWVAAVTKREDPDGTRLHRFLRFLNSVLSSGVLPDYLVLPEVSLPAHWFVPAASKLHEKGISLICGVEYLHGSDGVVQSQAWAALEHNAMGFATSMIYRQDKRRPALHEEHGLLQFGGRKLVPIQPCWDDPPIVNHGGFQFSVLICSELTNISYRAFLRGRVDAIFALEWNQDTESFTSIVESAALDVHTYVIQCNDRKHGDSRIRVPHKDAWLRDILRVKGGMEDYFVIGEIDVYSLRQFQSNYQSPDRPYKPVPDGFVLCDLRRVLPR